MMLDTWSDYLIRLAIAAFFALAILFIWWIRRALSKRQRRAANGLCTDRNNRESKAPCIRVPNRVYRRPDPSIYSQQFLIKHGIAVTWDNPDIILERNGIQVPSGSLEPDTEYDIIASIWNASMSAPVVNMPVRFAFLDFGIGTVSVPIGESYVDLPVKGALGLPMKTRITWHTPSTPGHYCIQIELVWQDDANPGNNFGQENVQVKPLNSPHAAFQFPLRNNAPWARTVRLAVDAYQIPTLLSCQTNDGDTLLDLPHDVSKVRKDKVYQRHSKERFPVMTQWSIILSHQELFLEPEQQELVDVNITTPDDFTAQQSFNINAFDGENLIGGVTLRVTT